MTKITQEQWQERRLSSEKRKGDERTEWERDYSRLVHSSAFRRLQSKTQVLGLGESDFYRTRLTHSMEVAQIGGGLLQVLNQKLNSGKLSKDIDADEIMLPDAALLQTICLAHDIGHPPFGHGGEVALNACMRDYGGFEGNGQTLRILSKLDKHSEEHGLNPTRRMLLGILKYPVMYSDLVDKKLYKKGKIKKSPKWLFKSKPMHPPKCYHDSEKEVVGWTLEPLSPSDKSLFLQIEIEEGKHKKPKYKSLDCWIMDIADEISYSIHDLEDAVSLGMITEPVWKKHFAKVTKALGNNPFDDIPKDLLFEFSFDELTQKLFGRSHERKNAIGSLVNLLINSVEFAVQNDEFSEPLLKYKIQLNEKIETLRESIFGLVKEKVIMDENVQLLEFKGQKLVVELFDVFASDPKRFLPESARKQYEDAKGEADQMRVICDFIAGMTDDYATRMYEKIFHPNKGSIFDRL